MVNLEGNSEKVKRFRIPNPDEVFEELESDKVQDSMPFKKKVEKNIASVSALISYDSTTIETRK